MAGLAMNADIAALNRGRASMGGGFAGGFIAPAEFGSLEFARATAGANEATTRAERIAQEQLKAEQTTNEKIDTLIDLMREGFKPGDPVNVQAFALGAL